MISCRNDDYFLIQKNDFLTVVPGFGGKMGGKHCAVQEARRKDAGGAGDGAGVDRPAAGVVLRHG